MNMEELKMDAEINLKTIRDKAEKHYFRRL